MIEVFKKVVNILKKSHIIKEGYIFIFIAIAIALFLSYFGNTYFALFFYLLAGFFVFFFRNPNRKIPTDESLLLSPADGKVMSVEEADEDLFLNQKSRKIVIFLSVFDVHVNRAPLAGIIKFRKYSCGGFKPAYKEGVGYENERHSIGIENSQTKILVTQIAGILARRIVSWVKLGDKLKHGQLYGMIKFGSCTEIFVQSNVEILVKKGDKVIGGESIIGRVKNESMDT